MGSSAVNNFNLDSEGHCFFCLNKIPLKVKQEEPELFPSATPQFRNNSVHYLARYLGMDMGKVLIEEGPRDPVLLKKLRKSRLNVELCEKCTGLNKTFSRLYRQLEKLEIEIKSNLGLIHEELTGGDKKHDINLTKVCLHSTMRSEISQIVGVLRQETIQKSFRKMGVSSPRVGVEKLTNKQIDAELSKHQTNYEIPKIEPDTSPLTISENVKTEFESLNENLLSDDDSRNYEMENEDYVDITIDPRVNESEPNSETEEEIAKNSLVVVSSAPASTNTDTKKKYSFSPKTGKWKCGSCSVELISNSGIHNHYRSVHQKIRYRCVPCGKEFVHKHVYDRHHQSVHVGVRFKCLVCNNLFTQKSNLQMHQRSTGCRQKGTD